jgi:hypothetical protein
VSDAVAHKPRDRGPLLAVLALVAIAVWFFLSFERVTEREHVGVRGEAARNPYLAAQRLVERMGMRAVTLPHVSGLDRLPQGAVLLLPAGRRSLGVPRTTAVLAWVEAGGHLVVQAERVGQRDDLLSRLGVTRGRNTGTAPRGPVSVALADGADGLRVRMPAHVVIDAPKRTVIRSADPGSGKVLLQFELGSGLVTVVTGLAWATTPAIGDLDHAAFLWQLVNARPGTAEAVFPSRLAAPSLVAFLIEHARWVLVASALLIAAWLWRIVPRFGPVAPDPVPDRRRLLDHLRAAGRYHWSSGDAEQLLADAAGSCLRALGQRLPGVVALPETERAAELARRSGLRADSVRRAFAPGRLDSIAFTEAVGTLQQLRERLLA